MWSAHWREAESMARREGLAVVDHAELLVRAAGSAEQAGFPVRALLPLKLAAHLFDALGQGCSGAQARDRAGVLEAAVFGTPR